jgi:hypothetical protein
MPKLTELQIFSCNIDINSATIIKLKNKYTDVKILLLYLENNTISCNWGPPKYGLRGLNDEPYISFSKSRLMI